MIQAVLERVLGYLSSPVGNELKLFLCFDQDLERLASLLTTIKVVLEDAEEKQFSNEAIQIWLQKLQDAALELEDIMEEYAYEELRLEYEEVKCCLPLPEMVQSSCLSSFHPMHVIFRYELAKRMKKISERLDAIAEERTKFNLIETVPERRSGVIEERRSGVIEWRQTTSLIAEPKVYGREENTDKIVSFLVGDASHSENLSVYPIIGLGGLGKTTLAQLIFNHSKVVNHFELRIWVCVSEDFSLKRMTKAIFEAASGHACEDLDLEPLQKKLQDLLRGKNYLLVLDDVWDDQQTNWQKLKSVLACGAHGASILVTTRLATVATIMGTIEHPHELSMLPNKDCWELFKHQVFGPNEVEQGELEDIGKEIVKKCRGVPLAAKAVGGLLRFKRNKNEWLNVKQSNLLELSHHENSIMPVLRLSYLNLPIKLRQCFAFCAIFPKDKKIDKQYLIELWMANGFISSNEPLDAEDVGDGVWNELYWRSFFQDIETNEFGKITSFKMHDLVHDLAQFVAKDACCINGVTTFPERIHHLYNSSREAITSSQLHKFKSLRTYIGIYNSGQLCKYYSLRVLYQMGSGELSSSIGDLKHLRYLNLSWGDFETLPESLCKLWNLQILKLDFCRSLQKLPNSLIRLKALQQLSLNSCDSLSSLPPHIGKLTSLKILSMYIVGKEKGFLLAELGALNLKRNLHIKHLEKVKSVMDAKEANLSRKQLNKLQLSWDGSEGRELEESKLEENVEKILEALQPDTQHLQTLLVEGYKGTHFPQWMSSPSLKYLTFLKLLKCESCLQLPALGKLPSLKSLHINNMINVKYVYEECYDGGVVFKALEFMSLENLPNLIRLSRVDGENMFPRLSTLEITECPKLLGLPHGFCSLKKFRIKECGKFNVLACFQCLTCLEDMRIQRCIEVEGLHEALQHMTALKELTLRDLPNLESLPDCFGNLPLLQKLRLRNLPNLESLPDSFGNLPLLQWFSLWRLPNLKSLPDCFGSLPLLRVLTIGYCPKLTCLPSSLSLSSLERLIIKYCPAELEKRCEKEKGEDWPKIAHIPDIQVGDGMFGRI